MSHWDEKSMEMISSWNPPEMSDCDETVRAMLEQTDPISQISPQANLSTNHQSEQRSSLGETENIMSPLAVSGSQTNVPSPRSPVSPGFSPSALLQSPTMFSNSFSQSPIVNEGPPETFNNDIPHQPMNFDHIPYNEGYYDITTGESVYVPSHESNVDFIGAPLVTSSESDEAAAESDIMNIISLESDAEEEFKIEENVDDGEKEDASVDERPPRKRKYEQSDFFGAKRARKDERVILRMECDEDNPDDGYQWRKYGRKTVSGNLNPRSYYKCTFVGCKVKKHVERGADDVALLVITYDGKHNHSRPTGRSSNRSGPRNRSGFSLSQGRSSRLPSSYSACQYCASSLDPYHDATQLFNTGLSKLPGYPVNHDHGFMYRNDNNNYGFNY